MSEPHAPPSPTGPASGPGAGAGPERALDALLAAARRGPAAAATALWTALTPRARAPRGAVAGARRALTRELLAPLVGHRSASVEPWQRAGDAARTRVRVAGGAAGDALVLVSLRRTDEGWRVTGLRRDDLPWS